jgi:excisionase family DNA binding protein
VNKTRTPRGLERRTYTVKEAAAVLGIGRNAVYELVHSGQLGVLRLGAQGHRMLIPKDAIECLLAAISTKGSSNP